MITAAFLALLLVAPQQNIDTTFAAGSATRISVETFHGRATIRAWDRADVRIRGTADGQTTLDVGRSGGTVNVEAEARWGPPGPVTLEINVPRRFSVDVEGVGLPVTVEGVQGEVEIENVEGAIVVRNVTGNVTAGSASAAIRLENVRGDVDVTSVNQGIVLQGVRGNISAQAVNGSITVRDSDSNRSDVSTVNGYVDYQGALRDGGRYSLSTHNGRITLAVPEGVNARMDVSAHQGKVEAGFPVPVGSIRDRSASITLGSGSARVDLETYNGTIYLVRPGSR